MSVRYNLQNFFEYFKDINKSTNRQDFNLDESNFDINNSNVILNSHMTRQEISSAIKGLKCGKAAGFDEFLNEYIKSTETNIMPLYLKLF